MVSDENVELLNIHENFIRVYNGSHGTIGLCVQPEILQSLVSLPWWRGTAMDLSLSFADSYDHFYFQEGASIFRTFVFRSV